MRVIENNQELGRYELYEQGDLAGFVQYSMSGDELWCHYIQLKRRYKSESLVEELLLHVLEDVHHRRLAIMPFCPAMRAFMVERPGYAQLIPPLWNARFLAPQAVPREVLANVRYTGSPKRRSTAGTRGAAPSTPASEKPATTPRYPAPVAEPLPRT